MSASSPAALVGFRNLSSLLVLVLALAAWGPAPAAARFASISFSDVKQCGGFSVDFAGGKAPSALPLTLTVLPINGTPISIPLPADAWNSTAQTGAAITFLPFPAGTEFVASLDDARGRSTALISDVLVVDPSDSNDTSCLPTNAAPFAPEYTLSSTLSQCETFNVSFNTSQGFSAPTIRAFIPRGASFPVNQTRGSDGSSGVATYTMDAPRDFQVLLQFTDPSGHRETSALMPVFGDIQSASSCIPTDSLSNVTTFADMSTSTSRVTPKIAVIVIAVCGGVVALVAMAMVAWYVVHRRKVRAQKFTKLDEARSPGAAPPDPEKQSQRRVSPPPRIVTSVNTSPISPVDSSARLTQYLRNPPYTTMGSTLVTPTSPDGRDPFGEQSMGSFLGPLSARESLSRKDTLGATALGNNGSSLTLPNLRPAPSASYSAAVRASSFEATERIPGTSPYFGRLAITPDNSLASNPDSLLRRPRSSQTSTSVSSQEIDHILEMATIYGADVPDFPQPLVTAPATLRSSAYMAGRESRRTSGVLSARQSPSAFSPSHSRENSRTLQHSGSNSTLRLNRFREAPLAPVPSSPLPSPNARPSFDAAAVPVRDSTPSGLQVPQVPPPVLNRSISSATRDSVYSDGDGAELEGFTMLQPPSRPIVR
ncbi:hypothetical protein C8Q78DRAFT_977996 [Trametes maxima]|nr:hypothetical protein C8Q78DRAFT_977996 [Trametes maxima]